MKTLTLIALAFIASLNLNAQNFTDNFESYVVGQYLGPQSAEWRTFGQWGEGSAEDVLVGSLVASSGSKSIYFASTQLGGGPQDVVLDFQNIHTDGIFTFQSKFYVLPGKRATFNLQESALGNGYALEVFMDNGNLLLQNLGSNVITTAYPESAWFNMTIICNLSTHIWELKIDGNSAGKWINGTNSVSYLEILPLQGAQFVMDDVSYSHTAYTTPNLNAASADLNIGGLIASQNVTPKLKVMNAGNIAITSFDAVLNYNGQNYTENVSGLNLAPLSSTEIAFSNLTLVAGSNLTSATISNVNGTTDDDSSDDNTSKIVDPVVPASGKMVVSEESTGTWCEWCPRGMVAMADFQSKYDQFWVGIAVHRNDPMEDSLYDADLNAIGNPSSIVDRKGVFIDPSQMTLSFLNRLQVAPKAIVEVGATFDAVSRELNVSGDFNFQSAATNDYQVAFVLTEDNVTGTTSGYAQYNAYSGGGNGPMGGYELLSDPVPASQMVYDHVARIIAPSFDGYSQSFPAVIASGSNHAVNHKFILPASWNVDKLHIVALLIAPNGQIDNAGKATVTEAVANGYVIGNSTSAAVTELDEIDATFKLFPNPATSNVNLSFNLKTESDVEIKVVDCNGKILTSRHYGSMNGISTIQFDSSALSQGNYSVEVFINGEKSTRKLLVQ